MGSTVRIAANIIIDGMASQNALQIQLIGHLTLLPGTGVRHCSGKWEAMPSMMMLAAILTVLPIGWTTKWKHLAFSKFLNVVSMKRAVILLYLQMRIDHRPSLGDDLFSALLLGNTQITIRRLLCGDCQYGGYQWRVCCAGWRYRLSQSSRCCNMGNGAPDSVRFLVDAKNSYGHPGTSGRAAALGRRWKTPVKKRCAGIP